MASVGVERMGWWKGRQLDPAAGRRGWSDEGSYTTGLTTTFYVGLGRLDPKKLPRTSKSVTVTGGLPGL
jgi:hypothetical protein